MDRATETIDEGQLLRGDPGCTYKFLEAKVAPSIDPTAAVDTACFMTTDTVDADDEVVLPSGADLSRFEKNPVLMLCHAYGQPGCYYPLPIGKVVWTKKRPNGVMAGIAFARSTAIGREVKGLFDEDMVRSFSIGFRSLESSPMTREEARSRPDWKLAYERTGGRILVHRKWSLLELSVAPIPSNEDALRAKYAARGLPVPGWINLTSSREATMNEPSALDAGTTGHAPSAKHPSRTRAGQDDDAPFREGDAVAWTRKGGGCGRVKSVHDDGRHLEDPDDDDSEALDASEDEPVARVQCYRKSAGGYVATDAEKAIHAKHLTRLDGGLPAPGPDQAKAAGGDEAPPADDAPIRIHDYVRINAPHHKGYGRVKSIHDSGIVPDVVDDVLGTRANPAARVKCYKAMGDGHVATDHHVGHSCKHLEKVEPLRPPSQGAGAGMRTGKDRDKDAALAAAGPLPPLVALTEQEAFAEALLKLNELLRPEAIQRMVAEELDQRMGYV